MLIYEVNLEVEEEINYKVAGWLTEHIQKVLTLKGFKVAYWFFRKAEDENSQTTNKTLWTIQYVVEDRPTLDAYFNEQAPQMRKEAIDRFGDKIHITRRILNLLNIMGLPAELEGLQSTKG
jgi:hypothetical protein